MDEKYVFPGSTSLSLGHLTQSSTRFTHGQGTKNLPARDFDMLLRKRRRLRAAKSCYPCRRRKVKCNLRQPCGSCIIRGHPELCDYSVQSLPGREQQPRDTSDGGKASDATNERTAAINMDQGLYLDPISHYSTRVHVGYESLPSLVSIYQTITANQPQPAQKAWTLGPTTSPQTVFELLCLQDSSTMFPFTNIWASGDGPDKVYSALPEDEAIWRQVSFLHRHLLSLMMSKSSQVLSGIIVQHLASIHKFSTV